MKVTYRGVSYDTAEYLNSPSLNREVQRTSRRVKQIEQVEVKH